MKTFLLILILTITFNFQTYCQNTARIEDDPSIKRTFSDSEIKSLDEIINFFDEIVLANSHSNNIDSAYHEYLEGIRCIYNQDTVYSKINRSEDQRNALFESLQSKGFFNEIWIFNQPIIVHTHDTTIRHPEGYFTIELNANGKYVEYLQLLSKRDILYSSYFDAIIGSGDIPPTIRWECVSHHAQFDFNIEYNRLWVAIDLLSIEESIDTSVEKYLENKLSP